jgi:hypothetical protein
MNAEQDQARRSQQAFHKGGIAVGVAMITSVFFPLEGNLGGGFLTVLLFGWLFLQGKFQELERQP